MGVRAYRTPTVEIIPARRPESRVRLDLRPIARQTARPYDAGKSSPTLHTLGNGPVSSRCMDLRLCIYAGSLAMTEAVLNLKQWGNNLGVRLALAQSQGARPRRPDPDALCAGVRSAQPDHSARLKRDARVRTFGRRENRLQTHFLRTFYVRPATTHYNDNGQSLAVLSTARNST